MCVFCQFMWCTVMESAVLLLHFELFLNCNWYTEFNSCKFNITDRSKILLFIHSKVIEFKRVESSTLKLFGFFFFDLNFKIQTICTLYILTYGITFLWWILAFLSGQEKGPKKNQPQNFDVGQELLVCKLKDIPSIFHKGKAERKI